MSRQSGDVADYEILKYGAIKNPRMQSSTGVTKDNLHFLRQPGNCYKPFISTATGCRSIRIEDDMLSLRLEFSEDMVGVAKPFPECQVAS